MKILPTIHFSNGRVASRHGDPIESVDPQTVIDNILNAGWQRIALMEIDSGTSINSSRELMGRLTRYCAQRLHGKCCLLVGGSVKNSDAAQYYVDHGASWLAVGTRILQSPMIADQLMARFSSHLLPSLQTNKGIMLEHAWNSPFCLSAVEMSLKIKNMGFKKILLLESSNESMQQSDTIMARKIFDLTKMQIMMYGSLSSADINLGSDYTNSDHISNLLVEYDFLPKTVN